MGIKKFRECFNIETFYVPSEVSLIKCRKLRIVAGTCEIEKVLKRAEILASVLA